MNENKDYITITIIIIFSIIFSTNIVAGLNFNTLDIEWGTNVSGTLYKGNTLTYGEYSIKAVDFTSPVQGIKIIENGQTKIVPETRVEPAVHLEIYKNNVFIKDIILTMISSSYTDPDYELKITATDFLSGNSKEWVMEYYKPWTRITIQKRGLPRFEVTYKFTPEKKDNIIFNGDTFTLNIDIKNNGEAVAKNVEFNLDIGPLRLISDPSKLHKNIREIKKDETNSFDIIVSVPETLGDREFYLNLSEKFYDVKNIEYKGLNQTKIITYPRMIDIDKSMKDRIYLSDIVMVRLVVTNIGTFDAYNIHVQDNLNGKFVLKSGNNGLEWNIPLLKPGQDWSTIYSVKALETNIDGLDIPIVNASFKANNKIYNVSSSSKKVIINGPKMIINKTVDKNKVNMGEIVNVNVSIKNAGNIGTRIEIRDTLPNGINMKEGILYLSNYSEPGSIQGFGYSIYLDKEGDVELPAVIGNYTDVEYKGTVRSVISSDRPVISVIDPKKVTTVPTPVNTISPPDSIVIPGFEGIYTVIGIIGLIIVINRKNN